MLLCGIVQVVNGECESLYKRKARPFWDSRKLSFHFTTLILKIYLRNSCFASVLCFFLHAFPGHPTKPKVQLWPSTKGDVTQMNQLQRKEKGDSLLGFNK